LIRDFLSRVRRFLNGLSQRERYAVYLGAAFIGCFLFFEAVVMPVASKKAALEAQLSGKQRDLAKMQVLQREYESLARAMSTADTYLQKRPAGFTLFSFLDTLAGRAGVKGNIAYMRPSETVGEKDKPAVSVVEMKLDGVSLEGLVSYLYMIETSGMGVFVTRLSIASHGKNKGIIEAVMRVEALI